MTVPAFAEGNYAVSAQVGDSPSSDPINFNVDNSSIVVSRTGSNYT